MQVAGLLPRRRASKGDGASATCNRLTPSGARVRAKKEPGPQARLGKGRACRLAAHPRDQNLYLIEP